MFHWNRLLFMSASNVYNEAPAKPGSIFFFPSCNLSLCDGKHESDQNPEWTQPKLFPHGEPWRRRLVWPHLLCVNEDRKLLILTLFSGDPSISGHPLDNGNWPLDEGWPLIIGVRQNWAYKSWLEETSIYSETKLHYCYNNILIVLWRGSLATWHE